MTQLKEPLKPAPQKIRRRFRRLMKHIEGLDDGELYGSLLFMENEIMNFMKQDSEKRDMDECQTELLQNRFTFSDFKN